jgi:hypothetical protein
MTDFYARLEEQLVAAGHRRQAQGRVGRALAGRARVLVAATAVAAALVAVIAFALPASNTGAAKNEPATPAAPDTAAAPDARLAGIRVAVYNATAEPGRGRSVGDELRSHGAHVAVFGSMPTQPGGRTIVRYVGDGAAPARRVAAALGVPRIERYDPSGAYANPPPTARVSVIVVAGYTGAAGP